MLDRNEISKRGYLKEDFRLFHLKDSRSVRATSGVLVKYRSRMCAIMLFTDSLIIWPRMTGEPELGVILYEYDVQEGGVTCTGHLLYIAPDGTYIPYGDAAEDAANQAVLAAHRENVETLLSRAREIWGIP